MSTSRPKWKVIVLAVAALMMLGCGTRHTRARGEDLLTRTFVHLVSERVVVF